MSSHAYQEAVQHRRVISIGNISFKATAKDVELAVKWRGLEHATFYWVYKEDGISHNGWVQIALLSPKDTKPALDNLVGMAFYGREVKTAKVYRGNDIIKALLQAQARLVVTSTHASTGLPPLPAPTPAPAPAPAPTIVGQMQSLSLRPAPAPEKSNTSKAQDSPFSVPKAILSQPQDSPFATPKSVSAKVQYNKKLADQAITQYPAEWIKDPENPDLYLEKFFAHYRKLEGVYAEAGVSAGFRVGKDGKGDWKFHSCQYPTPAAINDDVAGKAWITMTKGKDWKYAVVEDIPKEEADGWSVWHHPKRPVDADGVDRRKVNFTCDVQTTDDPQMDTTKLFANGLAFLRKAGVVIKPSESAATSLSVSDFKPPSEVTNIASLTTNHALIHKRPFGVGAGWGGYDMFQQWQTYGRQVRADMVEEKPYSKTMTKLTMISEDGSEPDWVIEAYPEYPITAGDNAQTLYERLNNKKDYRKAKAPRSERRGHGFSYF